MKRNPWLRIQRAFEGLLGKPCPVCGLERPRHLPDCPFGKEAEVRFET